MAEMIYMVFTQLDIHICIYIYVYICMYIYVCIYIYIFCIYTHTLHIFCIHTHTHTHMPMTYDIHAYMHILLFLGQLLVANFDEESVQVISMGPKQVCFSLHYTTLYHPASVSVSLSVSM